MMRRYEYEGFTLEVTVESDFSLGPNRRALANSGYVAVVKIYQGVNAVAVFSPLRFGEAKGRPFATEADAVMGGLTAARKIVDDLFGSERH
ncbi:hypothetical protein [Paraburkholderia sp. MM6662-R1]|uniref:hypothetical protein n=1 Tax=Paraburkholderia sp. MM6662-R1 TaxID=2991066 RepID=UPI003D1FBB2A